MPGAEEWFAERTYHHQRFADLESLVRLKSEQGLAVSVVIPTLNEAGTVGGVVRMVRSELVDRVPLVDEVVVMDSRSEDGTAQIAGDAGAVVYQDHEVAGELAPLAGKGEALWKSLFVARGDLVVWLDADIQNAHPRFVYGLLGPLLHDPTVSFVKALYERPIESREGLAPTGGGRVTELVARPLINMFWPELAGLVQPLSGEYAGRREMLERVPFFTGYGVEIGLVIDVYERFGLGAMAQVDLDSRIHRNREVKELSRMAFAIMECVLRRLESTGRVDLHGEQGRRLVQFDKEDEGYRMHPADISVGERPPATSVPQYRR